ncbi:MAG: F0F1 ATP synthase subunit A [Candidatus Eisenbacteria bacterium]|nr:F0F1 ATP synthase subunit A [Candidatus Eisenbacteria bacterium]
MARSFEQPEVNPEFQQRILTGSALGNTGSAQGNTGGELGPEFLGRVRMASLVLGGLVTAVILLRMGTLAAGSFGVGLGLSILNLFLLEFVARRVLRPEPLWGPPVYAALAVKLPLLLGGSAAALYWLHLSSLWFGLGFASVLVVTLLKVIGRMVTAPKGGSRSGGFIEPKLAPRRVARPGVMKFLVAMLIAGPVVYMLASGAWMAGDLSERAGLSVKPTVALAEEPHGGATEHAAPAEGHTAPAEGHTAPAQAHPAAGGSHAAPAANHGDAGHGEGGHAEGVHAPEFPNWIVLANYLFPDASWAHFLHTWETPLFSLPVVLFLCIIAIMASRNPKMVPGPLQNVVEIAVESFTNFVEGMLGPQGRQFVPFLGTLFFYIWFSNLEGLLPLMKSPTSVLNTTVALAVCVFFYVQYTGLTKLGPGKFLMHLAGDPKDAIGWAMVPLLLPLHIIGEFAKPMSLSLRLFGNVFGEDVLLAVFGMLILIPLGSFQFGLPLHLPFIFLALLLSSIQALVFTLLSTLYFSQMLPHEEHEGAHH